MPTIARQTNLDLGRIANDAIDKLGEMPHLDQKVVLESITDHYIRAVEEMTDPEMDWYKTFNV